MINKRLKILFLLLTINKISYSYIPIKVLLEEKNSKQKNLITIKAKNNMLLSIPEVKKKLLITNKKINILIKDNNIYFKLSNKENSSKTFKLKSKELRISPEQDQIKLKKNHYQGQLIIKIDETNEKVFFINKLDINDYLYSVLLSECYQFWPLEMQKIQATISRTYAIFHILQSQNKQRPYDIKRSNFHQTYDGFHNYTHLRQAITETDGLIITYNNQIALTMFDACCGGLIPAKMQSLDFKKAPYLARNRACNFCKNYGLYKWRRTMPVINFMQRLFQNNNNINSVGNLQKIEIKKKDPAGIVNSVTLFGTKQNVVISGNKLWEILRDKIKSLNFNIKKYGNNIIIEGKGFGHQIGLCQRGARELVKKGLDFKNIIHFYYPGIKFANLKQIYQ